MSCGLTGLWLELKFDELISDRGRSCQVAHSGDEPSERLKHVVNGVADPQDECLVRLNLLRGSRG